MTLFDRIKGVAIALGILLVCFPLAILLTFLSTPFWLWFEEQFGIEAYGHSGPAEWCYLSIYGLLVILSTYIWQQINKRNNAG